LKYLLLERDIRNEVFSTFDTISEEDIASSSNGDNVGVFAEGFEGYRVIDLS